MYATSVWRVAIGCGGFCVAFGGVSGLGGVGRVGGVGAVGAPPGAVDGGADEGAEEVGLGPVDEGERDAGEDEPPGGAERAAELWWWWHDGAEKTSI